MLALLPLACLALLAFGAGRRHDPDGDWRERFLFGLIVWGVLVVFVAESTSALRRFDRLTVAGLWALVSAVLAVRFWARPMPSAARRPNLSGSDWALIGGVAVVVALVGVTAVASPPNTWDALTYHMPRVAHWVQDRSVAHYPTHIIRQLYLYPWAEFVISQLQMLWGDDRFANLVQWGALAASLVAVSRIARQLGAGDTGQALCAVLAVSLPMAILQGSSAQTDLVTGFWVLTFVSSVLESGKRDWSPRLLFALGASLGLAVLTKPTAAIFSLPFLAWLAAIGARRFGIRAWRPILAVAAIAAALNLPHAWRNAALFGSPLGPSRGVVNEAMGPRLFVSNAVRNLALHAATPFPAANRFVENAVVGLHRALVLDVDDPRTTWRGGEFHVPPAPLGGQRLAADEAVYALFHEDTAGNPVQSLVVVAAAALLLARPALRARRDLLVFAAALAFAFFLFCAILKWQPWHSRLQLPLFLLASPLAAAVLSASLPRRAGEWIGVALLVAALPWVFANATRPLLGEQSVLSRPRIDQYFSVRPGLAPAYAGAARSLAARGCRQIGLVTAPDQAEYLLWVLLRRGLPGGVRIEHVGVGNVSRVRERELPLFSPCAVVHVVPRPEGEEVSVEMVGDHQ